MRPLGYLFSLPDNFFSNLESSRGQEPDPSHPSNTRDEVSGNEGSDFTENPRVDTHAGEQEKTLPEPTCNTCSYGDALILGSAAEQREHFKSDWHRYNLRRKLHGKPPVEEAVFEALIDDDRDEISSISGSDSEDEDAATNGSSLRTSAAGAQVVLECSGRQVALWKVLLGPDVKTALLEILKERIHALRTDAGIWCVLMSRGGHFAGAIVECQKKVSKQQNAPVDTASLFKIIIHKTFHRYVVRAKAGGKQSGKDATGKFAKSAGSQIRRHNEAALEHEIAETLLAWKSHFEKVSKIFLAAPGSNELQLLKLSQPVFSKTDPRISKVPFITNRPTLREVKRVVIQLLSVYEPQQEAEQPKPAPRESSKPSRPAIPKEKAPKGEAEPQLGKPPEPELHQAARRGDAAAVAELLRGGQDPTVSVGKTAYAVAADKSVRDAFRRHMALAPDQWDWAAAGVPSALTPELESEQQQKESLKKERLREKEKERKKRAAERKKAEKAEAAAKAEEEVQAAAVAAAAESKLGGGVTKKVQKTQNELLKRRESMAAAAEARIAALKLASQQQSLW